MRISFFGAALGTGNLGVEALCYSTIYNLIKIDPNLQFVVFDYQDGKENKVIKFGDQTIAVKRVGAYSSRRYYKKENLESAYMLSAFSKHLHPLCRELSRSDCIIDISGGDSFTDLYGGYRFDSVNLPKLLALRLNKPLVLLPQTYGPFNNDTNRNRASKIVKQANVSWARDPQSFKVLQALAGDAFREDRYRCGVDMAFGLPISETDDMPRFVLEKLAELSDSPKVGINVSGLIYNNPEDAKLKFGFISDYNLVVTSLVEWLLESSAATVFLVPHVVAQKQLKESDLAACNHVKESLEHKYPGRIVVLPELTDPREIKWVISKFDWFCGTRMHSTIAALSSGVPCASISYSPKTTGVFETCEQEKWVVDPTAQDTQEMISMLKKSFGSRKEISEELEKISKKMRGMVTEQSREIVSSFGA